MTFFIVCYLIIFFKLTRLIYIASLSYNCRPRQNTCPFVAIEAVPRSCYFVGISKSVRTILVNSNRMYDVLFAFASIIRMWLQAILCVFPIVRRFKAMLGERESRLYIYYSPNSEMWKKL